MANLSERNKTLTLYPFLLYAGLTKPNISGVLGCLDVQRVMDNALITTHRGAENKYSVIVDSAIDNFVLGRFVKLKKDNIEKLKQTLEKGIIEEFEPTGIDEFIEANAYFVWNLSNDLMLAEYNTESLNVLSRNSTKLLRNALKKCNAVNHDIELEPFPSREFIKEIIKNGGQVYKYHLSFKSLNKRELENIDVTSNLIWAMAGTGELGMTVSVKIGDPMTLTHQLYEKLKGIANRIRNDTNKYVVYTDEGNFDLIGEKFIYYSEDVAIRDTKEEYRAEIYGRIRNKLIDQTETLGSIRKLEELRNPRLDSFH